MTFTPKDDQERRDLIQLLATQRAEREAAARRLREAALEMQRRITALELAK
jgi:hypothetical protein